ncbi:MAG: hypothetical protein JJ913_04845 [Rhizobiaceae bacterium]|nr:hypothetical protein [Rhizobiaceae bacterium]
MSRQYLSGDHGPDIEERQADEAGLVRWAFFFMLLGTFLVLTFDFRDIVEENGGLWGTGASPTAVTVPVLPPAVETADNGGGPGSVDPREFITTNPDELRETMKFTLLPKGVLLASGSIDPGAAARFETEFAERGEYIRVISLDSPGGSLEDAMTMARTIRENELTVEVGEGALCASSCPLILAGGKVRKVSDKAAVGVHQFYAVTNRELAPEQAMADAQITTARITRHLIDMGVDPALWLHALDTPPRRLYYLSPQELAGYRLVTDARTAALSE